MCEPSGKPEQSSEETEQSARSRCTVLRDEATNAPAAFFCDTSQGDAEYDAIAGMAENELDNIIIELDACSCSDYADVLGMEYRGSRWRVVCTCGHAGSWSSDPRGASYEWHHTRQADEQARVDAQKVAETEHARCRKCEAEGELYGRTHHWQVECAADPNHNGTVAFDTASAAWAARDRKYAKESAHD